ncbi:hypothetical protein MBLNU457_g2551t1 [Dothideomycetes sp. NU457]
MLLGRLSAVRAPAPRPLRVSASTTGAAQHPRFLTHSPPRFFTAMSTQRPQVAYLSQPIRHLPPGPALQRQLFRLLTTETRQYVREQTWLALKWTAIGWAVLLCGSVAYFGWQSELIERSHPSPAEWPYFARTFWRGAWSRMDPEFNSTGFVNWAKIGTDLRHCLEIIEDPARGGKGLKPVEEGEGVEGVTVISDVGRAGFDITEKSLEWRYGYFEVLMGCARAAEHLDDMVRDKTRQMVFPKDVMIGPSNPNPRPVPPNMHSAPLEENCDRPYAPPETFYSRILTSKGFSTKQKLEAALAYGNWLEFKRANEAAEEVYKWAVDISSSAIPSAELAIDRASGILKDTANTQATANLLRASTALATHYSHAGNVTKALPIYLSVLRARRSAPIDPNSIVNPNRKEMKEIDYGAVYNFIRTFIRSSHFRLDSFTGDEPLSRPANLDADCTEAELMLYIGEILFATATSRPDDGLGWTKQAVEIAQNGCKVVDKANKEERTKCRECLDTGITNWSKMVARLAAIEKDTEEREGTTASGWKSWFSSSKKIPDTTWQDEAVAVETLRQKLLREGMFERMRPTGNAPGTTWVG